MLAIPRRLLALEAVLLGLPRAHANVSCEHALKVDTTGGIYWTNKTGWLTATSCCSWHIACQSGEITEIKLAYNGLAGTLSPELATLPFLNDIDVDHNSISGTVTPELGSLTLLRQFFRGGTHNHPGWSSSAYLSRAMIHVCAHMMHTQTRMATQSHARA